jgi:hypothetical protein
MYVKFDELWWGKTIKFIKIFENIAKYYKKVIIFICTKYILML